MTDQSETQGLTIAQLAVEVGVSAHTLRYYERAGLIHAVNRNAGNHRRYSAADVEWLRFLLRLRETGMPIARMRDYAELRAKGAATVGARMMLLEAHQAGLREQIALLRRHEQALDAKIEHYRRDLAASRAPEESAEQPSQGARTDD